MNPARFLGRGCVRAPIVSLCLLCIAGLSLHAQASPAGAAAPATPAAAAPTGTPSAQAAQTSPPGSLLPGNPAALLGWTLSQVIGAYGVPSRVYAVRGAEAWQDDVVFDYDKGFSFFFYRDRVWQIRVTKAYAAPVFGFLPGSHVDSAVSALGSPALAREASYEWILPAEAWPVRLRANAGTDGSLAELYLYRADF